MAHTAPPRLTESLRRLGLILSCAALLGCDRSLVTGTVFDVTGQALPGVSIHVEGTEYEALTNALGRYRIRRTPARTRLTFSKTGYAPAQLAQEADPPPRVRARDVEMWPLPSGAGVYLYEDRRYRETTWVEPQRFFMADGSMAYATQRQPETATARPDPLIVCYKTPRHDARLSRLQEGRAKRGAAEAHVFPVRTAAGTIRVGLGPIDAAEGILLRLELDQPLEPGAYAVHWGALDGYKTLEKRIFMFAVTEPEAPGGDAESKEPGAEEHPDRTQEAGKPPAETEE